MANINNNQVPGLFTSSISTIPTPSPSPAPDPPERLFSLYSAPVTNTIPRENMDLPEVVFRIRELYIEQTKQVRAGTADKAKILPYVTFSGTFSSRANANLINYSGFFCVDLDHINISFKNILVGDKVLRPALIFISPRGEGLKVVINIVNATPEKHRTYFAALKNFFLKTYQLAIDEACKDVARACFLCHDPKIYFNPAGAISSEVLLSCLPAILPVPTLISPDEIPGNKIVKNPTIRTTEFSAVTSCNEQKSILNRLCAGQERKGLHYKLGSKHTYLITLFGSLNRCGIPQKDALKLVWERFNRSSGHIDFVSRKDFEDRAKSIYTSYLSDYGKHPF